MYNEGMFRLYVWTFLVVIIIFVASPAYAVTAAPTTAPNLPLEALQGVVSELYTYSLKIVGLCVFVMFLLAGIGYILPDSFRPSQLNDQVGIIKDAVIGLVLLFSAYLILNTINPDLVGGGTTPRGAGNFVELAPPAQDFLQQPAQPANYVQTAAPVPDFLAP